MIIISFDGGIGDTSGFEFEKLRAANLIGSQLINKINWFLDHLSFFRSFDSEIGDASGFEFEKFHNKIDPKKIVYLWIVENSDASRSEILIIFE